MKRMIAVAVFAALSASLYAFAHDGGSGGMAGCGGMMQNGRMGMMGGGMIGGGHGGMMNGDRGGMMGGDHGGMMGGDHGGMMNGEGKGTMGASGSAEMRKRCAEMMAANPQSSASAPGNDAVAARSIHGSGVVRGVDPAGGKVTLQHGPIPAIGWPAMTMTFSVNDAKSLSKLTPGQSVDFDLAKRGDDYVITSIR